MAELITSELKPRSSEGPTSTGWIHAMIEWWAIGGGGVFCLLVLMSVVSLIGRKLFSMPIEGDMELLQMGSAIGAAAFLPACELHDHHIKVDALTSWMSKRSSAMLDLVAHALILGVALVLTWRTSLYVLEVHENHEVSNILLIPLWIPVAMLVPSILLLAIAAIIQLKNAIKTFAGGIQ